jgi:hypothetical protein
MPIQRITEEQIIRRLREVEDSEEQVGSVCRKYRITEQTLAHV